MYMTPYKKFYYYIIRCLYHLIITQKTGFVVNIGRAHLCASLGELSSEHAVFNISSKYS